MVKLLKRKILNRAAYWISYLKLIPILKKVNASSLIIDCGANMGDISALFLSRKCRVIAFEPDPLAFEMLQKRFKGQENIECVNKAVDSQAGVAHLFLHEGRKLENDSAYTVSSSLVQNKVNVAPENSVEVETVDLDHYISSLDRKVDVLKMDVEGAEINILNKLIANETYRKIGLILVETHENKIPGHLEKVADLKKTIHRQNIQNIKLNWI